MRPVSQFKIFAFCLLTLPSCGQNRYESNPEHIIKPVNTENKTVAIQEKKQYRFPESTLTVDNEFEGARLNGASLTGNTLSLIIEPENVPINGSSWYAFRITSRKKQMITIELNYSQASHRYQPKWSSNGVSWKPVDKKLIRQDNEGRKVWFDLRVPAGTLWIAGQEVIPSGKVIGWCRKMDRWSRVRYSIIGTSVMDRVIPCLDIYEGKKENKQIIAILGRQHPPEVTGYFALQEFVERLLRHENASLFFRKYRVIVLPLINPDGVDMGHWRHNANGVDLNRDYAQYHQPEIKAVKDALVEAAAESKSTVLMGLDFHSTYEDVFYTNREDKGVNSAHIKDAWLASIQKKLKQHNYKLKEEKHSVYSNASAQHWFYHEFKAVGITYEIGDDTPREFITVKARASADALISILLKELVNK
ncbi:MAG TPA: M14 family metallopeptidase [Chitinophagaceae bacterium]